MKKLVAAKMAAARKLKRVNRSLPMMDFDWYIPTDTPHQVVSGGYWIPVMVYVGAPRKRRPR